MLKQLSDNQYTKFLKDLKRLCAPEDSVVLYGSQINKQISHGDIDIVFVFKQHPASILKIRRILQKYSKLLDAKYYYLDELNPETFRECDNGVFALEYLANGTVVAGPNYFMDMLQQISPEAYNRSLREKIFGYVLRLRKALMTMNKGSQRNAHFKKYFRRVLIDFLLLKKASNFKTIDGLSFFEIVVLARNESIISDKTYADLYPNLRDSPASYQNVIDELSSALKSISL